MLLALVVFLVPMDLYVSVPGWRIEEHKAGAYKNKESLMFNKKVYERLLFLKVIQRLVIKLKL